MISPLPKLYGSKLWFRSGYNRRGDSEMLRQRVGIAMITSYLRLRIRSFSIEVPYGLFLRVMRVVRCNFRAALCQHPLDFRVG